MVLSGTKCWLETLNISVHFIIFTISRLSEHRSAGPPERRHKHRDHENIAKFPQTEQAESARKRIFEKPLLGTIYAERAVPARGLLVAGRGAARPGHAPDRRPPHPHRHLRFPN